MVMSGDLGLIEKHDFAEPGWAVQRLDRTGRGPAFDLHRASVDDENPIPILNCNVELQTRRVCEVEQGTRRDLWFIVIHLVEVRDRGVQG